MDGIEELKKLEAHLERMKERFPEEFARIYAKEQEDDANGRD